MEGVTLEESGGILQACKPSRPQGRDGLNITAVPADYDLAAQGFP